MDRWARVVSGRGTLQAGVVGQGGGYAVNVWQQTPDSPEYGALAGTWRQRREGGVYRSLKAAYAAAVAFVAAYDAGPPA